MSSLKRDNFLWILLIVFLEKGEKYIRTFQSDGYPNIHDVVYVFSLLLERNGVKIPQLFRDRVTGSYSEVQEMLSSFAAYTLMYRHSPRNDGKYWFDKDAQEALMLMLDKSRCITNRELDAAKKAAEVAHEVYTSGMSVKEFLEKNEIPA